MPKLLRGGSTDSYTTYVLMGLVGFLVILAALMWSNQIQFATTQDLNVTASLLTVTAVLLMFYVLYLLTASKNCAPY